MKITIYALKSTLDQSPKYFYVGSSKHPEQRLDEHKKAALFGHISLYYSKMREIGVNNTTFDELSFVETEEERVPEEKRIWEFLKSEGHEILNTKPRSGGVSDKNAALKGAATKRSLGTLGFSFEACSKGGKISKGGRIGGKKSAHKIGKIYGSQNGKNNVIVNEEKRKIMEELNCSFQEAGRIRKERKGKGKI